MKVAISSLSLVLDLNRRKKEIIVMFVKQTILFYDHDLMRSTHIIILTKIRNINKKNKTIELPSDIIKSMEFD
jgi:hypothetical protein